MKTITRETRARKLYYRNLMMTYYGFTRKGDKTQFKKIVGKAHSLNNFLVAIESNLRVLIFRLTGTKHAQKFIREHNVLVQSISRRHARTSGASHPLKEIITIR